MSVELALALSRIGRPRVLVVGDTIEDWDQHCEAHRFAQEAPYCPVWKTTKLDWRSGGAGAVAAMVNALGGDACMIDAPAPYRAAKTRHFVNGVQQLRIDTDAKSLSVEQTDRIAAHVADEVQRADCVLIADYGKGVCREAVLRAAIDGAKARGIPCIVDPAHGADWKRYLGVTAIKCNWHEFDTTMPGPVPLGIDRSCGWRERLTDNLVVTDGAAGLSHYPRKQGAVEYACRPRRVVDVTGAGDMVLAALGICIAGGMSWPDACRVANAAAGLKCERRGAVPVPRAEIIVDLLTGIHVIPSELLPAVSQAAKKWNGGALKVVWTNGCFDGGLHAGHVHLLEEAKRQGGLLIVGVNTDESVNYLKGQGRPLRRWAERSAVVAALACVDYVVQIGSQGDLEHCVKAVAPDVLVVGSDYRNKPVTGSEHSGHIHYVERIPGVSTSEIIRCSAHSSQASV